MEESILSNEEALNLIHEKILDFKPTYFKCPYCGRLHLWTGESLLYHIKYSTFNDSNESIIRLGECQNTQIPLSLNFKACSYINNDQFILEVHRGFYQNFKMMAKSSNIKYSDIKYDTSENTISFFVDYFNCDAIFYLSSYDSEKFQKLVDKLIQIRTKNIPTTSKEVTPVNNNNENKTLKMPIELNDINNFIQDMGMDFGIYQDDKIQSTILGTVVQYEEGKFRTYDRCKGEITQYTNIATTNLPILKLTSTNVKSGELILHNKAPYFIDEVSENYVRATNPITLTRDQIVPVNNPLGLKTYTKLISIGELLGFTGEKNNDQRIILWLLTILANKICSDGIDATNEKIKVFSNKANKYADLFIPFACVAFAAYAINNNKSLSINKISSTAKKTLGIDIECLKNKDTLKKIASIGMAISLAMKLKGISFDSILNNDNRQSKDVDQLIDKTTKIAMPFKNAVMKLLPTALAVCAVELLNNKDLNIETLRFHLEGTWLIVKEILCEKFSLSENIFNKDNLKKASVLSLVAIISFYIYGKKIKNNDDRNASNLIEQILPSIAPLIPIIVLAIPNMKDLFTKYGFNTEDSSDSDEVLQQHKDTDYMAEDFEEFDELDE